MEHKSILLPRVLEILKKEYFLLEKDLSIVTYKDRKAILTGFWVEVFFRHEGSMICTWLENPGSTPVIYDRDYAGLDKPEYQEDMIRYIFAECSYLQKRLARKHKKALKKIEKLRKEVERLRQKKRELKYAPGGKGFAKAEQHFSSLTE